MASLLSLTTTPLISPSPCHSLTLGPKSPRIRLQQTTPLCNRLRARCFASNNHSPDPPLSTDFSLMHNFSFMNDGMKRLERVVAATLLFLQIASPLPLVDWYPSFVSPAKAVLYSPDTKVPRTGELALRKAIPANSSMKAIQDSLEDISYLLRIPQRKPYSTMEGDVKKALKIAVDERELILNSIPADLKEKGSTLYVSLVDEKGRLNTLIKSIKENDPDKVSINLASSLDTIAELELLQAPGLSFLLPAQYQKYPRLTGRGTVEFTIERGDGTSFSSAAGGEPKKFATIQVC